MGKYGNFALPHLWLSVGKPRRELVRPWAPFPLRRHRVLEGRLMFASAMTMLGIDDDDDHTYTEIADAIRMNAASPAADLEELWRWMVFSVLVTNTDDHLKNHGFLAHIALVHFDQSRRVSTTNVAIMTICRATPRGWVNDPSNASPIEVSRISAAVDA